ncbi:MAG: O-antigen ligase family protein [Candidatus Kryptoniota bacterium]
MNGFPEVRRKIEFDKITIHIVIVAISIGVAGILIMTNGNIGAAMAFVLMLAVVFISFYRVDWAFYIFFGMVLLFDQFIVTPTGNPITWKVDYFDNIKGISYLPHFEAGVMNPLEIQLALMLLGWFIAASSRRTITVQRVPLWGLGILMAINIVFALGHGLGTGGDFLPALWEVRALFYFLLLYFTVPQIIQTRKQIDILLWVMIIMMTIKALQGAARFVQLGFSFGGTDCLTNHEDPVFIVDLWILLLSFLMLRVKVKQRTALMVFLLPMLMGFYAGQRRAAYAGLIVCIAVFILMLRKNERWKFFRILFPILVIVAVYSVIFWNSDSRIGAPVQLIKSGFFENSKAEAGERYSSNLYREFERYDLAATFQSSPALGIGFGNKYLKPLFLVPIPFPLRDWIPHDEILWLIVKMGAVGFFIFFLFIDVLLFETARIGRMLKDPFLRAIAIMVAAAIVNQIIVSYYDLQLTYYRNMVFLGTLCGLLPTLKAIHRSQEINNMPAADVKVATGVVIES